MANVFKQVTEPNNRVNKSSFDLSFQNNLTMQFGYLYPCFVKKVAPGTKMTIKPTFGLNFMPMMFPVQTRMRARMSFYKVRCRSVWKDYKDWFGSLKPNLVKPYINFNTEERLKKMASTGSLGDYLGLPTSYVKGSYGVNVPIPNPNVLGLYLNPTDSVGNAYTKFSFDVLTEYLGSSSSSFARVSSSVRNTRVPFNFFIMGVPLSDTISIDYTFKYHCVGLSDSDMPSYMTEIGQFFSVIASYSGTDENRFSRIRTVVPDGSCCSVDTSNQTIRVRFDFKVPSAEKDHTFCLGMPLSLAAGSEGGFFFQMPQDSTATNSILFGLSYSGTAGNVSAAPYFINATPDLSWNSFYASGDEGSVSDITLETSPYYNSNSENKENQLMLDASFFRAYEAIYNAYFRDIRNNPYKINGQEEYNVFIPSDEGGEDNNLYELRRRNWEADFLTTAVPSPQQGRAPLVGITTYNDTTNLAFVAEDGKKYAVNYDYDSEAGEMKNISFQQLSDDAVVKEARNMMDLVASGISISDLRNVNAYTKFLELNMRKGYFYKDLVEGHFDTKVRYDELNMPEFIGGTAKDVFVNPVSQTVQTSQDGSYFGALGSYAGQASVQGTADNTISVYCDEETIIMGLISIVPVANYSQLLPKHFLHRELLDSYFPEFDNIGFQPILYNEVCPIQAFNDNPETLRGLFGYQRPWYDYVASTDEVHGLFRTNLRNFLINRVFDTKPTLSPDFLLVDPEQVNDVFSVTQTTDKILGQIWFDVTVNAPISRIAIPRLD